MVALALGLSALLASSLSAPIEASRYELSAGRVMKFVAVNFGGARDQNPPAGIVGDVVTGTDRLRNAVPQFGKPKGAVVGRSRYRTLFVTAAVALVDVRATLPGGTVRAVGKADFRRDSNVIRVVGGTGVFRRATGTVEERALPNDQTLNIYRLRGVR